jgi:hypothetical protein
VIGLGRGRAGAVGTGRQPQVSEDGAHDNWVLNGGGDSQPAAASGTSQDIESEHAAHQRRPEVQACVRPAGRGVASSVRAMPSGAGAGVADDLRAPARQRGEDVVIHEQVQR